MATIDQIKIRYNVKELLDVTFQRQETKKHIRGYGGRPGRTETTVRYQVMVTKNTDAIAKAERRLGFRLYATNAPLEALSLSQAVLTRGVSASLTFRYRNQYIAERDFARLQRGAIDGKASKPSAHGRHLGITPLYVQRDDHACGLVRLLTLALRVMVMMEFLARRTLAEQSTTLSGIYAGNPKRATTRPTAEQMLAAFKEITLTTIGLPSGQCIRRLTPLTEVQQLILLLLGMSTAIYTDRFDDDARGSSVSTNTQIGMNPSTIAHRESL